VERNSAGEILFSSTYVLRPESNIIEAEFRNAQNELTNTSVANYDENGYLVREVTRDSSGAVSATRDYTHNVQGLLVQRIVTRVDEDFEEISTFEYDSMLQLTQKTVRNSQTNAIINMATFEHDANGFLVRSTVSDDESIASRDYGYNASGMLVGISVDFDDNGTVDQIGSLEYDSLGNLATETLQEASGALIVTRTSEYQPTDEPIFNFMLRRLRYFL